MNTFVDSEAQFLEQAVAASGFDDFGADEFRAGFSALLHALDEDSLLNSMGRMAIRSMIVRDLSARLIAERGFRQVPDSAKNPVRRPLVIIGLPRTGTTALQALLAIDPRIQGLELWLTRTPKPRPDRSSWPEDPDFRTCDSSIRKFREQLPELYAIHEMRADKVDECWNLMAQSFAHSSWMAQTRVRGYRKWFDQCDMTAVYLRHRRNLQLIGAREPEKRWMLKDSTHLFALDAFLEVYPEACVVQTHRDPVKSIPSVCSLCWAARETLNDGESRKEFGESTLDLWHMGIERTMALRKMRDSGQFFDVSFPRFRSDPVAVVEDIYRYFEFELSEETRTRMQEFRDENPPGRAGAHVYSLADWQIEEGDVRERFADYGATYDYS